jgi:hypothetical protein
MCSCHLTFQKHRRKFESTHEKAPENLTHQTTPIRLSHPQHPNRRRGEDMQRQFNSEPTAVLSKQLMQIHNKFYIECTQITSGPT